jgi:hypothetical protein
MSVVDVNHLYRTMDLLFTTGEESFLVPAKAGAHARQAQLFHQVSMSVVDVDHLNRTMDLSYSQRRIFPCPSQSRSTCQAGAAVPPGQHVCCRCESPEQNNGLLYTARGESFLVPAD